MVDLKAIEAAARRIRGVVVETPLIKAHQVSAMVGTDVYLKCENLQVTGSFKARGASNFVLSLVERLGAANSEASSTFGADAQGLSGASRRLGGIITASSGNHGQAVAYAAKRVGLPCTVAVPEDVIRVKEVAIESFGAQVVRVGRTSSDRIDYAERLAAQQNLVFVPPYDHEDIVAGQGTAGLEVVHSLPEVREVYVPVGGGGLISGVSTAVKSLRPMARVIGVEPELANDTYLSMQEGRIVDIGSNTTIADGLRTSHPGSFTFPIVQKNVDEIALVSEAQITEAMRILFEAKLVVEPSGCTSVAAVLGASEAGHRFDGPVVCVLSGGNVAPEIFASVLQ
ncbi:hypothetical protein AN477_16615 [Alicyclobacillus ferrooxydans]|uniref:threonine ammonia-lyase n=1 Tax=Alicyclobacillus ferrooxydans TaxID=471514 RepID=A0A0P9CZT2_9BACL|nr:hypothetical protein AN477_16615 [Alicyclobacillus ferrooxydans]